MISPPQKWRKLTTADLDRMNLPVAFWGAKLDKIHPSVKTAISNYLDEIDAWMAKAVGFLIGGRHGTGKTSIASVLAKAAKARGRSAYFTRVTDLRDAMKHDTRFSDDMTVWERCKSVDFLVIDDLAIEDATLPYLGSHGLSELILSRGEWLRTTVVTSSAPIFSVQKSDNGLDKAFPRLFSSGAQYLVQIAVEGAGVAKTDTTLKALGIKRG